MTEWMWAWGGWRAGLTSCSGRWGPLPQPEGTGEEGVWEEAGLSLKRFFQSERLVHHLSCPMLTGRTGRLHFPSLQLRLWGMASIPTGMLDRKSPWLLMNKEAPGDRVRGPRRSPAGGTSDAEGSLCRRSPSTH